MKYTEYREKIEHGTLDFPLAYYQVDENHPRYEMKLHWHPEYELIYVREGVLHMDLDGRRFDAYAGDTVFVTDGVCHGAVPEGCVYECLVFDLRRFVAQSHIHLRQVQYILQHKRLVNERFPRDSAGLSAVTHLLFESVRQKQAGYELFVHGALYQLLGIVVRDHLYSRDDAVVRRNLNQQTSLKNVIAYIEGNFEKHITLEELARAANMNRKYFCSFFRNMTQKTPFEYLNGYRLEQAGEMLLGSDDTVADIALKCGFNDVSYFSKMFRRIHHMTPLNYRKKFKNAEER